MTQIHRKQLDRVQEAYERKLTSLVKRYHNRFIERLKKRFQAQDEFDEPLMDEDEDAEFEAFLMRTVKVTLKVGRNRAEAEAGVDGKDTEMYHGMMERELASMQKAKGARLLSDQDEAYREIVGDIFDEYGGPNIDVAKLRLEKELGV